MVHGTVRMFPGIRIDVNLGLRKGFILILQLRSHVINLSSLFGDRSQPSTDIYIYIECQPVVPHCKQKSRGTIYAYDLS